jgi:8-amino-7-oxononanoate synthase
MSELDRILATELEAWEASDLTRTLHAVDPVGSRHLGHAGGTWLNFASNDYLGLTRHPEVCEAAARAARDLGSGSGASRLVSGSLAIHHRLEEGLAHWMGTDKSLVFGSGYAAALGVIPAVVGPKDVVILDKSVHACCVDGARLSGATVRVYRHNDLDQLERHLEWARRHVSPRGDGHILVVTESVFSMGGDLSPLEAVVELKDRHGAWLLVDEAHALGLFGNAGAGRIRHLGLEKRVEIQMGTLGKSLASSGGFVAGSGTLVEYLIHRARSFMFSTAPTPASSAAAIEALQVVRSDEGAALRQKVWSHARRVSTALNANTDPGSPILPVILGAAAQAIAAARTLRDRGLWVPAIRYPTVPRDQARLRITVTAGHTDEDIDRLLEGVSSLVDPNRGVHSPASKH